MLCRRIIFSIGLLVRTRGLGLPLVPHFVPQHNNHKCAVVITTPIELFVGLVEVSFFPLATLGLGLFRSNFDQLPFFDQKTKSLATNNSRLSKAWPASSSELFALGWRVGRVRGELLGQTNQLYYSFIWMQLQFHLHTGRQANDRHRNYPSSCPLSYQMRRADYLA